MKYIIYVRFRIENLVGPGMEFLPLLHSNVLLYVHRV